MALVLTRFRIEHDDPAIEITVGDIDLVSLGIHGDVRGSSQVAGIVAAHRGLPFADPKQAFALGRELEHHMIGHAVAANPDIVLIVHENAVFIRRPAILRLDPFGGFLIPRRSAPGVNDFSRRVECDHRRRRCAAIVHRRVLHRADLMSRQAPGPLDDPDIVLTVGSYARNLTERPAIGQLPGPGWINLVLRRLGCRGNAVRRDDCDCRHLVRVAACLLSGVGRGLFTGAACKAQEEGNTSGDCWTCLVHCDVPRSDWSSLRVGPILHTIAENLSDDKLGAARRGLQRLKNAAIAGRKLSMSTRNESWP